jgi:hypothetical protein
MNVVVEPSFKKINAQYWQLHQVQNVRPVVLTLPPKTGSLNEHINMFEKGIRNEAATKRSIHDRV